MNSKLKREHKALLRKWATGSATAKQMARCQELDRMTAQLCRCGNLRDSGKCRAAHFNGMNRSANINPFLYDGS